MVFFINSKFLEGAIRKMTEKRYIISDAAKIIEVEAHVLRYWEDELGVQIPRNELGHRYFTDYYIELFKKVKELKDEGFQLKAIKMFLPELMKKDEVSAYDLIKTCEVPPALEKLSKEERQLSQFQELISEVVKNAMKENTDELGKEVGEIVSGNVTREIDYLMHLREKAEEERFKKLDETIRSYQMADKEQAKEQSKRGFFGKFKNA